MSPKEHYEEAERLLEQADANEFHGDTWMHLRRESIAKAHVHAILAAGYGERPVF